MTPDPNHMPRGTYPVELRCFCKGNGRYPNTRCPDRASHGRWEDAGWYDDPPVYEEPHMRAAREYHAAYMASRQEVAARRAAELGEAS